MESLLDNLRFLGPEPASLSTPAGTRPLLVRPFFPLPAPEHGTGVRSQGVCSGLQVRTTDKRIPCKFSFEM